MESVEDHFGIRTELFDRADKGFRHITGGNRDCFSLLHVQGVVEEPIDRLSSFSLTGPDDTMIVKIVNQGKIFMSLFADSAGFRVRKSR